MAWLIHWGLCHPAGSSTPSSTCPIMDEMGKGRVRALGLVVSRAHITVSNGGSQGPWIAEGLRWGLLSLWPVACGHLEFKQKSHSKLKCMQRARLLQHQGLGSLCGLLMFPGCIPRPQVPPPETLLGPALFPEKMQGRWGKATALSPCLLLTPR